MRNFMIKIVHVHSLAILISLQPIQILPCKTLTADIQSEDQQMGHHKHS